MSDDDWAVPEDQEEDSWGNDLEEDVKMVEEQNDLPEISLSRR